MKYDSEQEFFDFSKPTNIPIPRIDRRGWKRLSVATGRCIGSCLTCTCISDLQGLAREAALQAISFSSTGSPLLTPQQLETLRTKRERIIPDETLDREDIATRVPPAPLAPCSDDEL